MELLTIILSGLLLVVSPAGIVLDQVAEDAIRGRLSDVESLDVRIDNGPAFQVLQGKVDRVRIAGRGIVPVPGLRIEAAEVETDPIDLAFNSLRKGEVVLDKPLQGAARLVITEADMNAFLASPEIKTFLSEIKIGSLNPAQARERERYQLNNPVIEFLTDDRLKLTVELEDLVQEGALLLEAETGLSVDSGDRLSLVEPVLLVNGQPAPPRLVNALLGNFSDRLNLQRFEARGLTARVLDFGLSAENLELALWVRVDPSVTAPDL